MSNIEDLYRERYVSSLLPTAERLLKYIEDIFLAEQRIDNINVRAKGIQRFVEKAAKRENGSSKYTEPLNQIQDQLGARIVVFYKSDVERLSVLADKHFRKIEEVDIVPDSESEFGYFGKHFIFFIPEDVIDDDIDRENLPHFFELQIKTLFQHAWGEANHDIGYKPDSSLDAEDKRKIAFTAAQAWGADMIFEELFTIYQPDNKKYNTKIFRY